MAVRLPGVRKPVGVSLTIPAAIQVAPGPRDSAFHGLELRAGVVVGELDLAFITPDLIMDRSGVLREAARRLAESVVAPPRDGHLLRMGEIRLPAGRAFSVDAVLQRGADGAPPGLPHVSVVVLGHPDVMLPLAVVMTLASARSDWAAGEELIRSVTFCGAPAGASDELVALPFAF
jgi:hypothetical protein